MFVSLSRTSFVRILREVLWGWSIHTCDDNVITLIWLQCHLIDGTELLLSEDLDFVGVDDLWCDGRVDTGSLDSNDEVTAVLDEHSSVEAENTGLIWLSDIGEDDINHRYEHSVLLGMSGILNNGDDICTLLSHVDEIATDTLGEFNSVYGSLWANHIGDMGHGGTSCGSDVEDLAARLDVDVVTSTADTSGNL